MSAKTDIALGAGGGAAGTVAMSAVMLALRRLGLEGEQPPERIVESALDAAGLGRTERTEHALAVVAHLAFGAGMGAAYRLLRRATCVPGPPVSHGVGWGLAVWAASYAGWIPALRIMPTPPRDRTDRQATMLLSHVVYGAVLGGLADPCRQEAR